MNSEPKVKALQTMINNKNVKERELVGSVTILGSCASQSLVVQTSACSAGNQTGPKSSLVANKQALFRGGPGHLVLCK